MANQPRAGDGGPTETPADGGVAESTAIPCVDVQALGGEVPVTRAVEALASRQEARLQHDGDLATRVSALAERVATLEQTVARQREALDALGADPTTVEEGPSVGDR